MRKNPAVFFLLIFSMACGPDTDLLESLIYSPSKVDLIYPENNSECLDGVAVSETESSVTFDWTDAEIGDRYTLKLTNLSSGEESVHESTDSELTITLLRGTPYRWSVDNYLDASNESESSDSATFYNTGPGLEAYVPFPPSAVSPRNGELLSNTVSVTLVWDAEDLDDDITSYDVYFGTENPPPLFSSENTENSVSNIAVANATTYYWRIVARDALENTSSSEVFTFETAD